MPGTRALWLAASPALPLAMVALPVYVLTPALYTAGYGLPLSTVGAILLFARLYDTAQDPLIGYLQDHCSPSVLRSLSVALAVVGAAAFYFLLLPVQGLPLTWQLGATLALIFTAHGWLGIALLRYGAALSQDVDERGRVVASREALGVVGVMLAAALPPLLSDALGQQHGLALFFALFAALTVASLLLFTRAPAAPPARIARGNWRRVLADRRYLALLAVVLVNSLAMALPATLFNFFAADALGAPGLIGPWLLAYFGAALLSLPAWLVLARRLGRVRAWYAGMALALAGFVLVPWLSPANAYWFYLVCVATGAALGADLAYSTALIADVIGHGVEEDGGSYFGGVSLVNKLALALGAGVALPLAAAAGYVPGGDEGLAALTLMYAGLPCLFKLFAWALLARVRPLLEDAP
ncbi:MFS transporter [Crenobacter caeni]|uniref:MFS transporter n=1 Tax=Crenobacter caeni TaxID=2705474 RepID=A0A6B2KQ65_9NEIS|nr:MFS transporter [Crenobacter caeni]NDV12233.1 MFS transporter [Crenobacter caeni]